MPTQAPEARIHAVDDGSVIVAIAGHRVIVATPTPPGLVAALTARFEARGYAVTVSTSTTSEPSSAQPRTPNSGGSRTDEGSDSTPEAAE